MKKLLVVILMLCWWLTPAFAEEEKTDTVASEEKTEVYTLEKVAVEEERKESGRAVIDAETLKSMPSRTGSITEALKGQSNVQFDYNSDKSTTGGEIRPPRVSISGAKPYENNFLIDGSSVTNTLNPSGLKDNDVIEPNNTISEGADQTIFYDVDMLESINIYSSNVPAKYGQFVGGVVDAKLRNPATDEWHFMVKGMHSRDNWANIRGADSDSTSSSDQARWSLYDLSLRAEGPINDKVAIMGAYTLKHSVIPLKRIDNKGTSDLSDDTYEDDDQLRTNENYFIKTRYEANSKLSVSMDGTYAPYREKRWLANYSDSYYESQNDSWRFGSNLNYKVNHGEVEGRFVYSQNGFSRDADSNTFVTADNAVSDTKVTTGNYGDSKTESKNVDAGIDFNSEDINLSKNLLFNYSTGVNLNYQKTDVWNQEAVSDYTSVTAAMTQRRITTYEEYDASDDLVTMGAYLQTLLKLDKLSVFPGLRLDYDDFARNFDLAPRFKAEYDIYGDGSARIVGGVNRYYGAALRAFAFDNRRKNSTRILMDFGSDGTNEVDLTNVNDADYNMDGLDTPYSDEFNVGLIGEAFEFSYGIELVHRDHEDQLISVKDPDTGEYQMTNGGKSTYDGITVTVSRPIHTEDYGNHTFSIGATESWTKTFNGSYNSQIDSVSGLNYDEVYYQGEFISRSDLPASNYNAPLVLTFGWVGSFWQDRLRFNSTTRWRDSTTGLAEDERENDETPYGTRYGSKSNRWNDGKGNWVYAYEETHISGGWNTDMTIEADFIKEDMATVTAIAQITNLFDDTTEGMSARDGGYAAGDGVSMGRSYYLGMRAEF